MDKIKLWEKNTPYFNEEFGQEEPALVPYLLEDGKTHPCVIVFPGGGYHHRAHHEGEPVAEWLNSIGFHSFVLEYRLEPYDRHAIMADAARSIRLVRHRAKEFGINPNQLGVLGFSAGGHLAYMMALRASDAATVGDVIDSESARPDFAIPCYAVASLITLPESGTKSRFMGEDVGNTELLNRYSADLAVTQDAPPMFIWHAVDDPVVSVTHSLDVAKALREKEVPFSLFVYPNGGHGKNLAAEIPVTCNWTFECEKWLYDLLEMEAKG